MILTARRKISLAVGYFAVASLPTLVLAQGNTFNPYGNSGYADYREFAKPTYANNPSLPGQARLQSQPLSGGSSRANQFEQYLGSIDSLGASASGTDPARGPALPGTPYYRTYRRFDKQYDRVYTPNNTKADRDFNARLKLRDERYAAALKETDPAKRAQLLKQIGGNSQARPAAPARPSSGTGSTPKARTTRPRSTTPPASGSTPTPASRSSAGPTPYPPGFSPEPDRSAPRPRSTAPSPSTLPSPATLTPIERAPTPPATP